VDRRTALARGGLAVLGLAAAGCGARRSAPLSGRRPMVRLAPVKVAWERIIRTTVGLRPHRPSGFMLRAEKRDTKTIIHNYGHGGAGMSLSWGTGQLAAELALAHSERRAAVLGCGVAGLTTARQLQRRGFEVTIYAATVPPDTTSNMSLAGFTPMSSLVAFDARTPAWDEQFRRAVQIAYRQLQLLVGSKYGVSWVNQYAATNDPETATVANPLLPDDARTTPVVLQPGEHPFPTKYAIERTEIRIEPSIYLDALMQDVIAFGGRIRVRRFESAAELMALEENVIVNCTGLGAGALFGDEELVPFRGQLVVLTPQDEVTYSTNGGLPVAPGDPGFIHMMPRHDGIILGGTLEPDVWTLEVNETERMRVMDAHMRFFAAIRA
jgi:glycine/D-amino acid oxidase-like deaminating enzyme